MRFEFLTIDMAPCPTWASPVYFGFQCPRNAEHMCTGHVLRDNPVGLYPPKRAWEWDGRRETPTFKPAIKCRECGAHGKITNGVWHDA